MKISALLFVLTIIPLFMDAQQITLAEAEAYAEQLVSKEILNTKGKEALLKIVRNKDRRTENIMGDNGYYTVSVLSKETILWFCRRAFFESRIHRLINQTGVEDKIIAEDSLIPRWTAYPPPGHESEDFIHPQRSTIGYTRTRTLENFKELGLISELVYEEGKKGLSDTSIDDEVGLTGVLFERSLYYSSYDTELKKQQQYISKLTDNGLLTKEKKDELLQSYKPYELKSISRILSYSVRYRFVDLTHLEANPRVTYPVIFQAIAELIPDFTYKNLTFDIEEQKDKTMVRQELIIGFAINGQVYRHAFFYDYVKIEPDSANPETPPARVSRNFHKGINKWLADIASPYRLYTVNIPGKDEGVYGESKVGLLLLKKGENELVSKDMYVLSDETFDSRLSQVNINKMIQELIGEGFFAHLSKKEMDRAKDVIFRSDIASPVDVFMCIPHTVVVFDWETGNLQNPYEDLTRRFEKASRGAFTLTNVIDEFEKGRDSADKVKYSFTLKGKKYETMLEFNSDWLDPKFMELLSRALEENKVDGAIHYCIDNGQEGGHIFLTAKQHAFVKKNYPDLIKDE